jgi:hypothetical protein
MGFMLAKLPGWVVDDVESVRREASRYWGMSVQEKIGLVASACRTAAILLDASPNRHRALRDSDPFRRRASPRSTA